MIFDWPATLIAEDVAILPPRKTVGMNTSLSGFTQRTPAIRPPFGAKLVFGNLFGGEVLAWRAMIGLFEGRTNLVRLPLFDLWFWANDVQITAGLVTHSDGSSFSDGALYLTDDLSGITVSAVQGQRNLQIDFGEYGQLLQAGLYFGIGDRAYLATQVSWEGTVATIRTTPTIRETIVDGVVKLRPTMLAGLLDDDQGELLLKRGRYGAPGTLELVERFDVPLS